MAKRKFLDLLHSIKQTVKLNKILNDNNNWKSWLKAVIEAYVTGARRPMAG